jgi:hypothetical protein
MWKALCPCSGFQLSSFGTPVEQCSCNARMPSQASFAHAKCVHLFHAGCGGVAKLRCCSGLLSHACAKHEPSHVTPVKPLHCPKSIFHATPDHFPVHGQSASAIAPGTAEWQSCSAAPGYLPTHAQCACTRYGRAAQLQCCPRLFLHASMERKSCGIS